MDVAPLFLILFQKSWTFLFWSIFAPTLLQRSGAEQKKSWKKSWTYQKFRKAFE